jgi:hypothetical protein
MLFSELENDTFRLNQAELINEIKIKCSRFVDKMSKLYRGPSIDASYQVSVHLAKGFQRRRLKCEKFMDDRQRTTRIFLNLLL